jgi:hypothetical protein
MATSRHLSTCGQHTVTIEFSNTATPKIKTTQPMNGPDITEILQMAPGWAWSIETTYNEGKIKCKFPGREQRAQSFGYDHSLNAQENHFNGAWQYLLKQVPEINGSFKLVGCMASEKGYVFTFL